MNKAVPNPCVSVNNPTKSTKGLSKAFTWLFRGKVLFRNRNKKFRRSFPRKDLFQLPRHLPKIELTGVRVPVRLVYCITVLRFSIRLGVNLLQ